MTSADLPAAEFGYPGPLRDRLVAAILAGAKTSTTSLFAAYDLAGEQLPRPGERFRLIDSADVTVGVLETREVHTTRLVDVDLAHVIAEGEGYPDVASWRVAHEQFWATPEERAACGDLPIDDDTVVVLERFELLRP
ncbi:MAG: RNA-binding protein [Actinobacteria bacterium HGW-Actinobacteria-2]|nr:MAG: RNA-binding protein [Actinobacteria bacterium HGW-Actinobacteria-2]